MVRRPELHKSFHPEENSTCSKKRKREETKISSVKKFCEIEDRDTESEWNSDDETSEESNYSVYSDEDEEDEEY